MRTFESQHLASRIFSSIQACQEQCSERNIAIPLPPLNLTWEYLSSGDCDYACHVESCHVGCQNLVNSDDCYSAESSKCSSVKSPVACRQGCRAGTDLFLHRLQELLNRVTIDAGIQFDGLQHSVKINFSFDESQSASLQEMASTDLKWVAMSRTHGGEDFGGSTSPTTWKWSELGSRAFKNSSASLASVSVPLGDSPEMELRLAARWRNAVVVSTTFTQTLGVPLNDAGRALPPPRPRAIPWARLQLSPNSYVICWRPDPFHAISAKPMLYRLRLFSVPPNQNGGAVDAIPSSSGFNTLLSTYYTASQCYLLRDLPTKADRRDFRVEVKQVDSREQSGGADSSMGISTTAPTTTTILPTAMESSTGASTLSSLTGGEGNATLSTSTELPTNTTFEVTSFMISTTPDISSSTLSGTMFNTTATSLGEEAASSTELLVDIHLEEVEGGKALGGGDAPLLLLTNGSHLLLMRDVDDFVVLNEPESLHIPILGDNATTITALTAISRREVLVGLSNGSLLRVDISPAIDRNTTDPLQFSLVAVREGDGVAITQVAVDHMQGKIYAVRNRSGLVRCASLSSCDDFTMMNSTSPLNFILSIAVDACNGYLYYVTNLGDTFSTPLFPIDAPLNYNVPIARRLVELPPAFTLEMDTGGQRLIALLQNGSLLSRDLVDERLKSEREGMKMSDAYKAVVKAQCAKDRLFWTSTSCGDSHPWNMCLYGEETDSNHRSIHLNKYLITGEVRDFTLMRDYVTPAFIAPPSKLGVITTGLEARLSWRPPTSLHYQAPGSSWRQNVYEVNITVSTDSSTGGGGNDSTISQFSTSLDDRIISLPDSVYSNNNGTAELIVSLRVCSSALRHVCSAWTHASARLYASDSKLSKTALLLYGRSRGITSSNSKRARRQSSATAGADHRTRAPAVVTDALGSEMPPEQMRYHPDLSPLLADAPSLLAVDNSTGTVYTAYSSEASSELYRVVLDTAGPTRATFIQWESIRYVAVSTGQAMIFVASPFTVASYRLSSSFEAIVHECTEESCGEVVGLAVDEESRCLLYLLQQPPGTVQLLSYNYSSQESTLITSSQHFLAPLPLKQMVKLGERLLFITSDGQVGTFDKAAIENINFNYAMKDIALAVGVDTGTSNTHRIRFQSPVEFDAAKAQLSWNIEPAAPGLSLQSIFKVRLYRAGSTANGEHSTHLALSNHFSIPRIVLDAWGSQQKFDVRIVAMNAWGSTSTSRSGILGPSKPPSVPLELRIFTTQQKQVDGTRAIIDLFWDEPKEWNGDAFTYVVNCSTQESMLPVANVSTKSSPRTYSFTVKSGKVSCAVAAVNEQGQRGAFSDPISIDGSELRPLVRIFVIDSAASLHEVGWAHPPTQVVAELGQTPSSRPPQQTLATTTSHKNRKRVRREPQPSQESQALTSASSTQKHRYQAVTFLGGDLYAVRRESEDSQQLFLVTLNSNDATTTVSKVLLAGGDLTHIEAMTADWLANRLLVVASHQLLEVWVDPVQRTSPKVHRLSNLSIGGQEVKQLIFDPFANTAYLLTRNGSLFTLDLNGGGEANLALSVSCLNSQTVTSIAADFVWNRAASPTIYALTWNGMVAISPAVDSEDSKEPAKSSASCSDVQINWTQFGSNSVNSISHFTMADKLFIFATPSEFLVYDRNSQSLSSAPIASAPLRQILAVSQSAQPYPNRHCFALPSPSLINFNVSNDGRTGALVEIGDPAAIVKQHSQCQNISMPPIQFTVQFRKKDTDRAKTFSGGKRIHVENGLLEKETDYEVSLAWFNAYAPTNAFSESKPFRTGYGYPSAPLNVGGLALSPEIVLLSWSLPATLNAPVDEIRYRVSQLNSAITSPTSIGVLPFDPHSTTTAPASDATTTDVVACSKSPCVVKVPSLRPSTDYKFWIMALHVSRVDLPSLPGEAESTSNEVPLEIKTKDIPGLLRLENVTSDSLLLKWSNKDSVNSLPEGITIQYRQSGVDVSWVDLRNSTFVPGAESATVVNITIRDLNPATNYDYRFAADYVESYNGSEPAHAANVKERYFQQAQQGRTKAGVPSSPREVRIMQETTGLVLRWAPPKSDGGEPILSYAVEYKPGDDIDAEWEIAERAIPPSRLFLDLAHDGTATSIVDNNATPKQSATAAKTTNSPLASSVATTTTVATPRLAFSKSRHFRVRAANIEGFGTYGATPDAGGEGIVMVEEQGISRERKLMFWLLGGFLTLLVACCVVLYAFARRKNEQLRRKREKLHKVICLEDICNQIQFPVNCPPTEMRFPPEVENELIILPKISRECIKLRRKLGDGSFGEVWEGVAYSEELIGPKSARVAVKYLKKGNDDESRAKFLREAIMMNNFDHLNIIKLIGVSREVEPHFLVIELMEGGDLRGFLRSCRPSEAIPSQICLIELIAMIIDVGRGCTYLENRNHVHRDLAARNCLISSREPGYRITKIGDFGLARDLFAEDYYRMHGQDLVPLRWLSPESMTNGLFTSKTDMWAFGILMWEVMSLGGQPYGGYNNIEVVTMVKEGCVLAKSPECPEEIYELMQAAWTLDADRRPSFRQLMPELERLRSREHLMSEEPFPLYFQGSTDGGLFDKSHSSSLTGSSSGGGDGMAGSSSYEQNSQNNHQSRNSRSRSNGTSRKSPPSGRKFEKSADNQAAWRGTRGHAASSVLKSLRKVRSTSESGPVNAASNRSTGSTSPMTCSTNADYEYEVPRSLLESAGSSDTTNLQRGLSTSRRSHQPRLEGNENRAFSPDPAEGVGKPLERLLTKLDNNQRLRTYTESRVSEV